MRKRRVLIAGVMTGTSADGVDVSLISFSGGKKLTWETVGAAWYPFPKKLFEEIIRFQEEGGMTKKEYLKFSCTHGSFVGSKVKAFMGGRLGKRQFSHAAVAYHGQTIAHYPARERVGKNRYSFSLQAGDPSVVSNITGLTVVSNFRLADIAAGGSGAPLSPPFHAFLLDKVKGTSAFLNIGGIGNLTVVRNGRVVTASDTGPGNMLIDGAVRFFTGGKKRYDSGGQIGLGGSVSESLLRFLAENDEFLRKKKPASTGRESYGKKFLETILSFSTKRKVSQQDVIATLTHYTGLCVSRFIEEMNIDRLTNVYVGGGGARNRALMSVMAKLLPAGNVGTSHEIGVDPDFAESAAFAYLGYLCLAGTPVDTSSFTGGGEVLLGKITPGVNYSKLMRYFHHR